MAGNPNRLSVALDHHLDLAAGQPLARNGAPAGTLLALDDLVGVFLSQPVLRGLVEPRRIGPVLVLPDTGVEFADPAAVRAVGLSLPADVVGSAADMLRRMTMWACCGRTSPW
jgi:hypothetical protein